MTIFNDTIDYSFDATAVALILTTLTQVLPPLAALLSVIWVTIRILETCTVRRWAARLRRRAFSTDECLSSTVIINEIMGRKEKQ